MRDFKIKGMTYPAKQVGYLVGTALEGGSNYWYWIKKHNRKELGLEFVVDVPLHDEGVIEMYKKDEDPHDVYVLDRKALESGLEVFRVNYPKHYADWLKENEDACTGDVFLQCCLFGEVIFG